MARPGDELQSSLQQTHTVMSLRAWQVGFSCAVADLCTLLKSLSNCDTSPPLPQLIPGEGRNYLYHAPAQYVKYKHVWRLQRPYRCGSATFGVLVEHRQPRGDCRTSRAMPIDGTERIQTANHKYNIEAYSNTAALVPVSSCAILDLPVCRMSTS